VDRLLTCPACAGRFTFAEWSRSACCPHCGARVDFAAASGSTSARSPARERLFAFGKPLALTRAWIVVFAIWAVAGGLLVAARVEMGHLPVLTAREKAAIGAVEKAHMADGTSYGQALRLARRELDPLAGLAGQGPLSGLAVERSAPRWYVIDRPWEHTVYVAWELEDPLNGQTLRLVWTVQGGSVKAESSSYAYLQEVVKAAARNPGGSATSPVVLPDPDALTTAQPSPIAP
jgi:hypothetical protein